MDLNTDASIKVALYNNTPTPDQNVTAANTAGAAPKVPFFNTSSAETVDTAAQATQEPQAQILPAVEAIAEPAPAPAPEPAPVAATPAPHLDETSLVVTRPARAHPRSQFRGASALRQAIVAREVLGPPLSLRPPRV